MKTISLKISDRQLRLLDKAARLRGVTRSEIIRDSVEQTLAVKSGSKVVSCYDLSKDIVGSIKSGVRDLATNPKYMEGFGE